MKHNILSEQYNNWLKDQDFNDEQIEFLVKQVNEYHNSKDAEYFDYDSYERNMWYEMNRSGLFENDENNKTEIYSWEVSDTRRYITEILDRFFI